MTRAATGVRLRSSGGTNPARAAATLSAAPGEVVFETAAGRRVLRVGTDVVAVRWDRADGGSGRAAFLGAGRTPAAVVDLIDWVPSGVDASGFCRGGLEDPVEWTGLQSLADAAGLPIERGRIDGGADVWPGSEAPAPIARVASYGISATGLLWVAALALGRVHERLWLVEAVLALTLVPAAVLFVEQRVRRRRALHLPDGDVLAPRPSVPVHRRFRRVARLVLTPSDGAVESVVLRDTSEHSAWFDGPSAPLGVQRVLVVTPAGADRPERVDFVDGLGREVIRLPWDEWFGGGAEGLDVLAARGLPVDHVSAPSLGRAAPALLTPRSGRFTIDALFPPGGLGFSYDVQLAAAVSLGPVVLASWGYDSRPTLLIGAVNTVLLWGPPLLRLTRQLLDRPR